MKTSTTPFAEIEASKPQAVVVIADPQQIEIMQSAEIVYRELKARGVRAIFDDVASNQVEAPVHLTLSDQFLRGGAVELRTRQQTSFVSLEDAAEKTVEVLHD